MGSLPAHRDSFDPQLFRAPNIVEIGLGSELKLMGFLRPALYRPHETQPNAELPNNRSYIAHTPGGFPGGFCLITGSPGVKGDV